MNNITIFNNDLFGNIRTLMIDETIYFVASDVAKALGYKKPNNAINTHCKHTLKQGITDNTGYEQLMNIIPESDVYRLAFKSKLPEAEKFEQWVVDDVLPQLRKTGVYITANATKEDVDFELLFGKNRIYDTFFNSNDVEADYDKFKEWSKAKRDRNHHAFNNQDRIKLSKKIIEALENKARFAIASRQSASKILSYQELSSRVQTDITALTNQRQGGLRAQVTRKLNKLKDDYDLLVFEYNNIKNDYQQVIDENEQLKIQDLGANIPFTIIDKHGFSNNKMYKAKGGMLKRTNEYNIYENSYPKYILHNPSFISHVDITKPMAVELKFSHLEGFDVHNFIKPTIDIISRAINCDDVLFTKVICSTESIVDSWNEGQTFIKIYNI